MEDNNSPLHSALGARGLAIRTSPQKGRCLIAARRFSQGEVVLEQDPYAAVLNTKIKDKRCDGCYKMGTGLKRCSACKNVWYCGNTCQRNEWKLHQIECRAMVLLMREKQRTLMPSLQLMLRLLAKRKLQADEVCPLDAMNTYQVVEALPTHYQEMHKEQVVLYAQMASLVHSICVFDGIEIKEITQNFCRFACNAHTICDEELSSLGTGLYPALSIMNHSCNPNCVVLFEGKHAVVRATEPILEGFEVTVSYVELGTSAATRRGSLREQYFFDCDCSRCIGMGFPEGMQEDLVLEGFRCLNASCEGLLLPDKEEERRLKCQFCSYVHNKDSVIERAEEADKAMKQASQLLSTNSLIEARHAFEHVEQLQTKVFHPYSVHLMRTRDNLLKVCISMEDWTSALNYCRQSLMTYKRAYPGFHPLLGLQLYTCGKLEWYLGNTKEAVEALTMAMQILEVTHGPKAELVGNLRSTLQEALAEAASLQNHKGIS